MLHLLINPQHSVLLGEVDLDIRQDLDGMDPECAPRTIPVTRTAEAAATGNSVPDLGDSPTRPIAYLDNTLFDMRRKPGGPYYCVAVAVASSQKKAIAVKD